MMMMPAVAAELRAAVGRETAMGREAAARRAPHARSAPHMGPAGRRRPARPRHHPTLIGQATRPSRGMASTDWPGGGSRGDGTMAASGDDARSPSMAVGPPGRQRAVARAPPPDTGSSAPTLSQAPGRGGGGGGEGCSGESVPYPPPPLVTGSMPAPPKAGC